jgi:hypothetical protein
MSYLIFLVLFGVALSWSPQAQGIPIREMEIFVPSILEYNVTQLMFHDPKEEKFLAVVSKNHFVEHELRTSHP